MPNPGYRTIVGLAVCVLAAPVYTLAQPRIDTIAGRSFPSGSPALSVGFAAFDLATDASGNVYTISGRRILKQDTAGIVSLLYESPVDSNFPPLGLAVSGAGQVYFSRENRVWKLDPVGPTVYAGSGSSGFAGDGGPATSAGLWSPRGLALDGLNNLFIVDIGNNRVRRVDAASGVITTAAGNGSTGVSGDGGSALSAAVMDGGPAAIAIDPGGRLYIGVWNSRRVRMVDLSTQIITTYAGTGQSGHPLTGDGGLASSAIVTEIQALAVAPDGSLHILTSSYVRRVDRSTNVIQRVVGSFFGYAGDGGPAINAAFNSPRGLAFDASGNIYVADTFNYRLRRVLASTGVISTIGGTGSYSFNGDGQLATAATVVPRNLALDSAGGLLIADTANGRIRRVDLGSGQISTVGGNGQNLGPIPVDVPATQARLSPSALLTTDAGEVYLCDEFGRVLKIDVGGILRNVATVGGSCLAMTSDGAGALYVAGQNQTVQRVDIQSGSVTVIAGITFQGGFSADGIPATSARLATPAGVAVDADGNVYLSDMGTNRVRRIDAATGLISTVANFMTPSGLSLVDRALYVVERGLNRVRLLDLTTGVTTTVAGNGTAGFSGDGGSPTAASLLSPEGVTVAGNGDIYVADTGNERVRRIVIPANTPTGEDVVATPAVVMPDGSAGSLQLTFENVIGSGDTTVTTTVVGPPPPAGFKLSSPPVYYNITTTASFSGTVRVCLGWREGAIANESRVTLFHHENGGWVDITDPSSRNTAANIVCGNTSSLSPFALMETRYSFAGFFQPVDNYPVLNVMKAGAAVPLKFSLGGDQGLAIFFAGSPASQQVSCDSGASADSVEETVAAGLSGLSYDSSSGVYNYVWKTDKSWAGTCRRVTVKLNDGESYIASFRLAK